jgi:TatA/E family protein of Tat protein translocase
MGQLGFQELIIIFVIALLVFGPKKLPELGKSLGKGLREFKRATEDLKSNWDDQMRDVEEPLKDAKKDLEETGRELKADFHSTPEPSNNGLSPEGKETAKESSEKSTETSHHPEEPAVPKEK